MIASTFSEYVPSGTIAPGVARKSAVVGSDVNIAASELRVTADSAAENAVITAAASPSASRITSGFSGTGSPSASTP